MNTMRKNFETNDKAFVKWLCRETDIVWVTPKDVCSNSTAVAASLCGRWWAERNRDGWCMLYRDFDVVGKTKKEMLANMRHYIMRDAMSLLEAHLLLSRCKDEKQRA